MSIIEKAMGKKAAAKPSNKTNQHTQSIDEFDFSRVASKSTKPELVVETESNERIQIDQERLKDMGMVTHSNDRSNLKITNEYRSIKQKLIYNAFGLGAASLTNPNLVMVSSTMPHEGKTFTSINLALSVASEKDKTVLLVDADILKPDVSKTLGIDERPGLIDYLVGDVNDIADVIYSTSIPNLKLLPAGSWHHLSNELLSSDKMRQLTGELATRYGDRMVIFDCPPLLGVVETLTISNFLGQAMIVVEAGKTKLANVEETISQLNPDMAIGFILNKSIKSKSSHYGYGYGYGHQEKKA